MVNSDFPYAVASGYFPPRSVDHRKELFAAATGRCWEESRAEAWRASQYGGRDAGVVWALFVGNFPTNTTPSVDMLDIVQAYQQDKPAVTTMRPSVWQAAHDVLRKCTAPTDPPVRSILDSIVHGRLFTTHYSSNQVPPLQRPRAFVVSPIQRPVLKKQRRMDVMCSKMLYSDEQEKHATQPVHNKTNHCSPAGASPHVCTPHDAPALVAEEEQAPEEQAPPLQLSVQATANLSAKHSLVKGRDPVTDTQSQPGCVEHCQNNHVKLHDGADNLHCSNPFAEEFQQHMLAHLQPHYTQWQGVVQCTEEHLRHLHAAIKKHSRSTGPAAARMQPCTIGPVHLCIGQCIGTGGFARIYQVTHSCDDDEISCPATQSALKLQQPSCAWEFFILTLLQARCHPAAQCLFANAQQLFLFPNASGLLLTLGTHGTLQELVNVHLRAKMAVPEVMVAWFAAELCRIGASLHACDIMHTDIKPDNLLIRCDAAGCRAPTWDPLGAENTLEQGWHHFGLQLIDFGRAVDMQQLPQDPFFMGDSQTEFYRCPEMDSKKPWTGQQLDAYCIAGVVHCLLFGRHMTVHMTKHAPRTLKAKLRRYWNHPLWGNFFHTLLNANEWPDTQRAPWEALLDQLHEFLAAQGTSSLRTTVIQQLSMLTKHTS